MTLPTPNHETTQAGRHIERSAGASRAARTTGLLALTILLGACLRTDARIASSSDEGANAAQAEEASGQSELHRGLPPLAVADASIRVMEHHYDVPGGPFAESRRGDYVLSNNYLTLVFASIEPMPDMTPSVPSKPTQKRPLGALIDVMTEDHRADTLKSFSQAVGVTGEGGEIEYTEAVFVQRDGGAGKGRAVGLRLLAPAPGHPTATVQTTYWLAPGESRVEIETEVLNATRLVLISDLADWGPGQVIAPKFGVSSPTEGRIQEVAWFAVRAAEMSIGLATFEGAMHGWFRANITRTAPYKVDADGNKLSLRSRWLFFAGGDYSDVTDQIFRQVDQTRGTGETGFARLYGRLVVKATDEPTDQGKVEIYSYDPDTKGRTQIRLFTRVQPDAEGRYSVLLPMMYVNTELGLPEARYVVGSASRSRLARKMGLAPIVHPGTELEFDINIGPPARLTVHVVDADSGEPLVGRVRIDPIVPSRRALFESIIHPAGYQESFYVSREGTTIELAALNSATEGKWSLAATAGPEYDNGEQTVAVLWGRDDEVTISLKRSNPTEGWQGAQIGAMTRATRGCALTAEEVVLMAAGEGIDWLVSGDFEVLTDLAPAVKALALEDQIKTSRGFRTWLPGRPDWGSFLIYPVAADAPDPRAARSQWNRAKTATEFLATLRRLYPGALIEAANPYSDWDGYFYAPNRNVYEMAFEDLKDDIDTEIDAINVFPDRENWSFGYEKDFFFISTLRNRFYIPAPLSAARMSLLGEPGYPRLMIRTGTEDITRVTDEQLIESMKQGYWQVSSGPFIHFEVEGVTEGDTLASHGNKYTGRLRVTAPNWASSTAIDICKEGLMSERRAYTSGDVDSNVRHDVKINIETYPQYKGKADTLLSAIVTGATSLDPEVPAYGNPGVVSFAMTSPILADSNDDGKWDPPIYRDKGK